MQHRFIRSRDAYIIQKKSSFIGDFIDDILEGLQHFVDLIADNSTSIIWIFIICWVAYLYNKKNGGK